MASETIDQSFINIPRRTFYFSLILHIVLPLILYSTDVLDLTSFDVFKKKSADKIYQDYVQIDMVALPEKVGFEDKFIDPALPIVKNPIAQMEKEAAAEKVDEDSLELAEKAEMEKKAKEKAAEAKKKKIEAEKAKKEAKEKKKLEQEEARKKALADLNRRIEQEKAIKNLQGSEQGRAAIAGNITSEGTSTQGKSGGKGRERYLALVSSTIKEHFNVFAWLKNKKLESEVAFTVTKEGKIKARRLVTSSGNERFDSAALQAVDDTRSIPLPEDREILNEILGDEIVIKFDSES